MFDGGNNCKNGVNVNWVTSYIVIGLARLLII